MDVNVLIFVISAVAAIVLLSIVVAFVKLLRKTYSSTHYNKIKEEDKTNFRFVIPTHVPKTTTLHEYGDDDVTDTDCGKIDADMIDPELYGNATKETRKDSSATTLGWLCFNVRYEPETEKLIVDLVRGQHITQRKNSTTDLAIPYVKVCLLPDKKKKLQTKTRQKTSNPLFNEQFIFSCSLSGLKERSLRFTVFDFDRFSRQSAVGKILYPLEEDYENILMEGGCEEIWREIDDCGTCEVEVCNKRTIPISKTTSETTFRAAEAVGQETDGF